jgi:anti-sigma B factor antagonist
MADITYSISDLISIQSDKKIKLITLEGQLDESNVDAFAPKVYEVIEQLPSNSSIIIDLEKLTYLNSKSIGYISDFYTQLQAKSSKLIITKPASNIRDIFNVVGLDQVIDITQTLEEAKSLS